MDLEQSTRQRLWISNSGVDLKAGCLDGGQDDLDGGWISSGVRSGKGDDRQGSNFRAVDVDDHSTSNDEMEDLHRRDVVGIVWGGGGRMTLQTVEEVL